MYGVIGHAGRGVYESTIGYLECLRNQYFKGEGAFIKNRETQLSIIMKGGRYCEGEYPGGRYYNNVLIAIYKYNWDRYDKKLFKKLEKRKKKEKAAEDRRKRLERQKKPFHIIFDGALAAGTAVASDRYIKHGSTIIFQGGVFEITKTDRRLTNTIILGPKSTIFSKPMAQSDFFDFSKFKFDVKVFEDAKG